VDLPLQASGASFTALMNAVNSFSVFSSMETAGNGDPSAKPCSEAVLANGLSCFPSSVPENVTPSAVVSTISRIPEKALPKRAVAVTKVDLGSTAIWTDKNN
jgi:hypothetical protein